jgi:hypothetical protein
MTDDELMALFESVGLIPGQHWKLAKVDGKSEIVVSLDGLRMLAWRAPDQDKATELLAAFEERLPSRQPQHQTGPTQRPAERQTGGTPERQSTRKTSRTPGHPNAGRTPLDARDP